MHRIRLNTKLCQMFIILICSKSIVISNQQYLSLYCNVNIIPVILGRLFKNFSLFLCTQTLVKELIQLFPYEPFQNH